MRVTLGTAILVDLNVGQQETIIIDFSNYKIVAYAATVLPHGIECWQRLECTHNSSHKDNCNTHTQIDSKSGMFLSVTKNRFFFHGCYCDVSVCERGMLLNLLNEAERHISRAHSFHTMPPISQCLFLFVLRCVLTDFFWGEEGYR